MTFMPDNPIIHQGPYYVAYDERGECLGVRKRVWPSPEFLLLYQHEFDRAKKLMAKKPWWRKW